MRGLPDGDGSDHKGEELDVVVPAHHSLVPGAQRQIYRAVHQVAGVVGGESVEQCASRAVLHAGQEGEEEECQDQVPAFGDVSVERTADDVGH